MLRKKIFSDAQLGDKMKILRSCNVWVTRCKHFHMKSKEDFEKLGIRELLTPQRRNGLGSLIQTISTKVQAL